MQGLVPGRHSCMSWVVGSDWGAKHQILERSWEKGSGFFPPIRKQKCLVTCMNHMLIVKTWIECTIPFIGTAIVKINTLTTEYTCTGMFPPWAWHWCEAHTQKTCHLWIHFVGPSLVWIEFISAKYLVIISNVCYRYVIYSPLISQYYNWNV